ncbi:MAG: hypothetical protein HOP29_16325 [Phycisphaerales bacterium]|nr:hypothetical protein [Phycisphaerales bacterium]
MMLMISVVKFALFSTAMGVGGSGFEMHRYTVDGGGAVRLQNGAFEISGSIGQSDAGKLNGGAFQIVGGYGFELAEGDCNEDAGVNLFDYESFAACQTGPGGGTTADCICADFDGDDDVDLLDFQVLQLLHSD